MSRSHATRSGLLREGQEILDAKYQVERFLGEGAFAEVYRVQHEFFGRQALKVFKGGGMTRDEIKSVLGEAVLLSKLEHPNIIRVFDAGTLELVHGAHGYFTMEFVGGGSLDRYRRSQGDRLVPVEDSVEIVKQLCRGLTTAHGESPPIVHRDVKPPNILVGIDAGEGTGARLRVRLSDFGLAKRVDPLTLKATALGTVAFKAPEAFRDPGSDSCAGDVWAVGTVAYLLLTDTFPYQQATGREPLGDRVPSGPEHPPSRLNIDVDPKLDRIVLTALALDPDDRYPTAKEMLDDLSGWSRPGSAVKKESAPLSPLAPTSKYYISPDVSSLDEEAGEEMARQAVELARQKHRPAEAADLMEEAFSKAPGLRERYANWVRLWRNGVIQ